MKNIEQNKEQIQINWGGMILLGDICGILTFQAIRLKKSFAVNCFSHSNMLRKVVLKSSTSLVTTLKEIILMNSYTGKHHSLG